MDTIVLKVEDFLTVAGSRGHTTYEQLADATGLGVGTLHRVRNGGPAGPETIAAICRTYGVAFEDVFTFGTINRSASNRHKRENTTRRAVRTAA